MGMFDWYEPRPPLGCPRCGAELKGWQGKSGPCALFECVQGIRVPARQLVDDGVALSQAEREPLALPDAFEIYTKCVSCNAWIDAHGSCEGGIWTRANF